MFCSNKRRTTRRINQGRLFLLLLEEAAETNFILVVEEQGFRLSNEYSTPAPTVTTFKWSTGLTVSKQTYPISVGAGGTGGPPSPGSTGNSGSNSGAGSITSTECVVGVVV